MPQRRVASMVRKLAQALEEAHYNGVVHRDLKPSNIMVNARGDLIIMDFGLVWRIGAEERAADAGRAGGGYAGCTCRPSRPPARWRTIGPGCDIYSLGVILYELLTGRRPFRGAEAIVLGQVLFVEPPPPSRYRHRPRSPARGHLPEGDGQGPRPPVRDHGRTRHGAGRLPPLRGGRPEPDRRPPAWGSKRRRRRGPSRGRREGRPPSRFPDPTRPRRTNPSARSCTIEVPESGTLWKSWRQWTAIIEHFAQDKSHIHVNKQSYDKLYRTLIAACRGRAAKAQGPRREFYRRLTDLVIPWMTPMVLESTDREILFSVLSYCRQFEQELLDPTELPPEPEDGATNRSGWWLALVLLLGSFVVALIGTYSGLVRPHGRLGLRSWRRAASDRGVRRWQSRRWEDRPRSRDEPGARRPPRTSRAAHLRHGPSGAKPNHLVGVRH